MSAQILLIRHAAHAHLGHTLTGRLPNVPLSTVGRDQARALSAHLAAEPISAIHSSPLLRAHETAAIIADGRRGDAVQTVGALDEIDFGEWEGRAFAELADDPRWTEWNSSRDVATTPGGETMGGAQERAWSHIAATTRDHPGQTVVMVSHCDVIRAIVARVLGLPLGRLLQFEIGPASVSRIEAGQWGARLLSLNEVVHGR